MKYINRESASIFNRKRYFESIGIDPAKVVIAGLIHGNDVKIMTEVDAGKHIPDVDGLVTNCPGVVLSVTAADCLPVYFIDQNKSVIGLAHAGWRGTAKNMAGTMVDKMVKEFACDPKNIFVYIGPYIKACHFEVENVIEEFIKYPSSIHREASRTTLDLGRITQEQLVLSGVAENHIVVSDECTYCLNEKYFSYRRDKPTEIEAMVAFIGII